MSCCGITCADLQQLYSGAANSCTTPGLGLPLATGPILNSVPMPPTAGTGDTSGTSTGTIGTGSSSGVSFADLGGFIADMGSSISKIASSVEGPQFTRLPNGQILTSSGQVLGGVPMLQGGQGTWLLLIAAAVVLFLVFSSRGEK